MIKTICYGKCDEWKNRQEAIDFFLNCMVGSEGSEQERYATILCGLYSGSNICSDE